MRKILVGNKGRSHEIDIYTEEGFHVLSDLWSRAGWQFRSYHDTTWLGIPILQLPQDLMMVQELIWRTRPDVIVETGLHLGGSAVFYASMLALTGKGHVISVELQIPRTTRASLAAHPLGGRIALVEGSSIDDTVVARVRGMIKPEARVLVALDSDHSRQHVRQELEKYSPLVQEDSYIVVFDGNMEDVADAPHGRPEWVTDNPAAAMRDFLEEHPEFESDKRMNRLGATHCPGGFLRRKGAAPSEDLRRDVGRLDEAVAAIEAEHRHARTALERSLSAERRRHEAAEAALRETEATLRQEIRDVRAKLMSVYGSRTWRTRRFVARLGPRVLRRGSWQRSRR